MNLDERYHSVLKSYDKNDINNLYPP